MNNNYANILKAGFDIDIRSQAEAMARIYLTKNGERTGHFVRFRSGHRTASTLTQALSSSRVNTHLDKAMAILSTADPIELAIKACLEREALQQQLPRPTAYSKTVKI